MADDLTCVNVTEGALVEFIERVAVAGGSDIKVSQGDRGWYVTYRPPFTRDIKEDGALVIEEAEIPEEFIHLKEDGALVIEEAETPEEFIHLKMKASDAAGPLCCQSCIKIKACKQIFVETGTWPVLHDCFVPDRCKKYPQFEMNSCEECNVIHSCIARYDMDRANWKCAKGKVHLNFTEVHDAPCTPQMVAEADCEGDRAKCGDACHAKSKQKND